MSTGAKQPPSRSVDAAPPPRRSSRRGLLEALVRASALPAPRPGGAPPSLSLLTAFVRPSDLPPPELLPSDYYLG